VTAAQALHLVEAGIIGLDDPAADYLPPKIADFDVIDATIRDLLGMRSGLNDPASYDALDARGDIVELVGALEPSSRPGGKVLYANVKYDILGVIIEQVTGRRLPRAVRGGVLNRPGLERLVYRVGPNRTVHDGHLWADAATLARWGYELYGRSIVSDASLRAMTDFDGQYYGLGTIDFTHPDADAGYDVPSIGHGGLGESHVVRLVAFPQVGVVVAVQANADGFEGVQQLVEDLRDEAHL
jgi:D-alanyl-D-alanine carboxypeptidase